VSFPAGFPMNESQHQLEETIFYDALQLADPAQRNVFLEQACAGDSRLRAAVEDLLAIHAVAEPFFAESELALTFEPESKLSRR
jgi:hypothetical protein